MTGEEGGGLYYPDSADEAASDPSVILAGIKQRAEEAALYSLAEMATLKDVSAGGCIAASAIDVPSLLAAVEAVLKLTDGWLEFPALVFLQEDCAHQVREAITSALTGTEKADAR